MTDPKPKRRSFYPMPSWLVLGLLAATGVLFLSERFRWFAFNQHKGWTVLIAVASVGVTLGLMVLWLVIALIFRLPFQFSIRSLLVLVVAVALPCSWLAAEMKKASEQQVAVDEIRRLGGRIEYGRDETAVALIRLLGDDFFNNAVSASLSNDDQMEYLRALQHLTWLHFRGDAVTDSGLQHLQGRPQLGFLYLTNTQVTDNGLQLLQRLPQLYALGLSRTRITDNGLQFLEAQSSLHTLDLSSTRITDSGLRHLRGLSRLTFLNLGETAITDNGLQNLVQLNHLSELHLYETKATNEGVDRLRQALPKCAISFFKAVGHPIRKVGSRTRHQPILSASAGEQPDKG